MQARLLAPLVNGPTAACLPTADALPPPASEGTAPRRLPAAVPCQLCNASPGQLPHMNCANIDCNELFISCEACRTRYQGCCCDSCMAAPRLLRPIKIEGGHYQSWTAYNGACCGV